MCTHLLVPMVHKLRLCILNIPILHSIDNGVFGIRLQYLLLQTADLILLLPESKLVLPTQHLELIVILLQFIIVSDNIRIDMQQIVPLCFSFIDCFQSYFKLL